MNDRKLLELAAKAYGIDLDYRSGSDAYYYDDPETGREQWCPQDDDGQSLRLMVKLKLRVFTGQGCYGEITTVCFPEELNLESVCERHNGDPYTATRRAIVRAAALIGARHG